MPLGTVGASQHHWYKLSQLTELSESFLQSTTLFVSPVSRFDLVISLDVDSLTNDSQPIVPNFNISNLMPETNYAAGETVEIRLNISE